MRTLGHVDGVQTAPKTLYQTVPSTAEGVEAFRAPTPRGGSTTRRTSGFAARSAVLRGAGPALRRRVRTFRTTCMTSRASARRRRAAGRRRDGLVVSQRDLRSYAARARRFDDVCERFERRPRASRRSAWRRRAACRRCLRTLIMVSLGWVVIVFITRRSSGTGGPPAAGRGSRI